MSWWTQGLRRKRWVSKIKRRAAFGGRLLRVSTNDEASGFTGELNIDYWLIVALAIAVAAFWSLSWPRKKENCSSVGQGRSRLHAELGAQSRLNPQKRTQRFPAGHAWIAENVHEQRVRTGCAIKLPSSAVARAWESSARGVVLLEAPAPFGRGTDTSIRCWEKVAVLAVCFLV